MNKSNLNHPSSFLDPYLDELIGMIRNANTISVLHKLEYHRKNLIESIFSWLLQKLTTRLNDQRLLLPKITRRKTFKATYIKPTVSSSQIEQCCLVVLYYIVSILHKYQICVNSNIWEEILKNPLTNNIKFLRYLHQKNIVIPKEIRQSFASKISNIVGSRILNDRIKLIELGFISDKMITDNDSIRHLETIFSTLKQHEMLNENDINVKYWITLMDIPEKLSLFLSYFPNYDIHEINEDHNKMNVLEQVMHMKPYFYLSKINTNNQTSIHSRRLAGFKSLRSHETSELILHPNDIDQYRAARIVTLIQQLIHRGAQLSKPISFNITSSNQNRFFNTSLGMYVLLGLYTKDLYFNVSYKKVVYDFVLFILNNISGFDRKFENLILRGLSVSIPLVHESNFINQRRQKETEDEQRINDKLFQRSINLKDWCRLKIREHCSLNDIPKLDLPKSLVNYCSFGVHTSHYGLHCVKEVIRYSGNIWPTISQISHQILIEDDDETSTTITISNDDESDSELYYDANEINDIDE